MKKTSYWMDTDFHYGNFKVPKFALYRKETDEEETTEEIVLWSAYEDLRVDDLTTEDLAEKIDQYIEEQLGFLPDYEIG